MERTAIRNIISSNSCPGEKGIPAPSISITHLYQSPRPEESTRVWTHVGCGIFLDPMSAGYTGKVHSESARQCVLGTLKTLNKAQMGLKRTEWQSWVIKRGGDILIRLITTSGKIRSPGGAASRRDWRGEGRTKAGQRWRAGLVSGHGGPHCRAETRPHQGPAVEAAEASTLNETWLERDVRGHCPSRQECTISRGQGWLYPTFHQRQLPREHS